MVGRVLTQHSRASHARRGNETGPELQRECMGARIGEMPAGDRSTAQLRALFQVAVPAFPGRH
jgi:hypothetical protein